MAKSVTSGAPEKGALFYGFTEKSRVLTVKQLQLLVVFNAALFPLFPKIVVVD